ncbi:MAG: recombinase family protein [Moorea sp. SIO2B7]|nr:recombinase family protein [Moorena sp. SIO2B7]
MRKIALLCLKYVTPKEACSYLGVSISTFRRWDAEGKIRSIRTPGGQRRFWIQEYEQKAKPTVLYARVSTHSQKDVLRRQAEFLQRADPNAELIREIGSGLNFRRRKLIALRKYKKQVQQAIQDKTEKPDSKVNTERCIKAQGVSI